MSGYQKLIIMGNLGSDPEMKYTSSGQAVTNFSVAVNSSRTDSAGVTHERTTWFRVSVWGKQAETCNLYLTKGREVLVEGKIIGDEVTGGPRIWTDRDGKSRASFEMTAFDVRFGKQSNGNGGNGAAAAQVEAADPLSEDEIPF